MQVLQLSDVRGTNDRLRAQLAHLIAVVGTPSFEPDLFEVAHDALECAHLTAFVAGSGTTPRLVLAATAGPTPVARSLADKYIDRYWDLDPVNRALQLNRADDNVALRINPEEDIGNDLYRHDCYIEPQISERLTLTQQRGDQVYRLNFYAGRQPFSTPLIDHLLESSDLLMSLVMKHDTGSEAMLPHTFIDRLRLIEPNIPQREAEVCTAIMLGMTSEAIALKLGISVNTVLTYRKRAYNRLNISCQNELMRLILV